MAKLTPHDFATHFYERAELKQDVKTLTDEFQRFEKELREQIIQEIKTETVESIPMETSIQETALIVLVVRSIIKNLSIK